jgi:hypothetical protein
MSNEILSESRFDEIVQTVPVHHRIVLYRHFFALGQKVKTLETQIKDVQTVQPEAVEPEIRTVTQTVEVKVVDTDAIDRAIEDTKETVRKQIVDWLRVHHTTDTVRASYARKLADRLEAKEDEPVAP